MCLIVHACMPLFVCADVFVTESRDNILCSWMLQCKKTCLHVILTMEAPTCHKTTNEPCNGCIHQRDGPCERAHVWLVCVSLWPPKDYTNCHQACDHSSVLEYFGRPCFFPAVPWCVLRELCYITTVLYKQRSDPLHLACLGVIHWTAFFMSRQKTLCKTGATGYGEN